MKKKKPLNERGSITEKYARLLKMNFNENEYAVKKEAPTNKDALTTDNFLRRRHKKLFRETRFPKSEPTT